MSSNALACICNVINPCRNEVSTTFVVVQWLITGFAALAQVVRPVLLLCKMFSIRFSHPSKHKFLLHFSWHSW